MMAMPTTPGEAARAAIVSLNMLFVGDESINLRLHYFGHGPLRVPAWPA
jgi:hypothetical protein